MDAIYDNIVIGSELTSFATTKSLLELSSNSIQLCSLSKRDIFSYDQYKIHRPFFFFNREVETWKLIDSLGLRCEVATIDLKDFLPHIFISNSIERIPLGVMALLTSSIVTIKAKLALLKNIFLPIELSQNTSLYDYLNNIFESDEAEVVAEIICSKLRGGEPRKLDYLGLYPELLPLSHSKVSLYSAFTKGLRREFGGQNRVRVISGGEVKIKSKLVTELGVNVHYGVTVNSIKKSGATYRIYAGDSVYLCHNIVFACPAVLSGGLLKDIDLELSDLLRSIQYSRSIEVSLTFKSEDLSLPIKGRGIIFPEQEKTRIRRLNLLGKDHQFTYIRCMFDGHDGNLWGRSDSDLEDLAYLEVKSILRSSGIVIDSWINKKENNLPLYHIGHKDIVELIESRLSALSGVHMIGNFLQGIRLENILRRKVVPIEGASIPKIVLDDPYLGPQTEDVVDRRERTYQKEIELSREQGDLVSFASGHHYFGIHQQKNQLIIREWAPNATSLYLLCEHNEWGKRDGYCFRSLPNGVWELSLESKLLDHLDQYRLLVEWDGGSGERIPSYANYVVQDPKTHSFSACVWSPKKKYKFKSSLPKKNPAPIIYECHVGMSSEEGKVNNYNDFTDNVLPGIVEGGYNTVQIMAIQEHPYYGSFGYQVSNFFAPSSRSGTPDELKRLIDTAHGLGVKVIMDIVHSHAVKNENEGLGNFDGTRFQYFHEGERGLHPAWDTYCFNYASNSVLHFLLSNVRYWMEEFQFDGFRHDGVTSMLYLHHGLEKSFSQYSDYFGDDVDHDAITYLSLANKMMKDINPNSISIAEDMSGLPGIAAPVEDGGLGFDYRLAMGIPDFWIKMIKDRKDEEWSVKEIWDTLMDVRYHEGSISYVESHDQALVGDKTTLFRLIDKDMYTNMSLETRNHTVDRGISVQKLIRLITLITSKDGYLNFMGNEFGHPEWIDFPRVGNDWSYHYARRQWSLRDNPKLCYKFLSDFDNSMLELAKKYKLLDCDCANEFWIHDGDKVIAVQRGELYFVFNFAPQNSYRDYMIAFPKGEYELVMHSDQELFGGYNNLPSVGYKQSTFDDKLSLYIPSRTVQVFRKV
ncbi:MAG: alpha amylase C-terminal domain-containing protein [Bacteriovoracaceae bacterium]|nr:alpha amylase C-terminal domain-containing protein [Bacteriovoracaceae bacterium]